MKGGGGKRKPTKKTTSDLPKQKQKSVQNEQENEYDDDNDDEQQEQVPELAEGYYVIESVRKKRVHKGATQYLIKWQGWPESANTWEPVENLSVCPELIEAFEERSNGKRKRRHGGATMSRSKEKEKQQMEQQVPEATEKEKQQVEEQFPEDTYPVPAVKLTILEEPCLGRCVHMPKMSNVAENTVVGTTDIENANPLNNTVSVTGSLENGEMEEMSKSDVEVIDPKATSSKDEEAEFGIHIQEYVTAENGISNVDTTEILRTSPRLGTRRRKSCSVKRFKKDPNSFPKKDAAGKTTAACDVAVQDDINNGGDMENGLNPKNVAEIPRNVSVITKIVKPVNYSTSILNDVEEVCVSFLVKRSDGEEVVVDNKYLKENNPVLLINFYEQHLRYNNPSE
uniref:chromo domain-containing protein LHP1-like n=1 Tax=Erigeron canadensis TaxID=72917 RepID=UPI001CB9A9EC|nr:chromo domain-containing protein LHP1-like [Erigeron canadensis]